MGGIVNVQSMPNNSWMMYICMPTIIYLKTQGLSTNFLTNVSNIYRWSEIRARSLCFNFNHIIILTDWNTVLRYALYIYSDCLLCYLFRMSIYIWIHFSNIIEDKLLSLLLIFINQVTITKYPQKYCSKLEHIKVSVYCLN